MIKRTTYNHLCVCEGCCAIYRVAVGLLIGQDWEQRRPTLPMLRREKTRPVGLGLFPLSAFLGDEWAQRPLHRPIIRPVC